MIINVTTEHINKGQKRECKFCPVALAIREKTFNRIYVHREQISFNEDCMDRESYIHKLPEKVTNFIDNFDGNVSIKVEPKPISFHLSAECFMVPYYYPTEKA